MSKLQITKNGPVYEHLVMMSDKDFQGLDKVAEDIFIDVEVDTLQKLFDYEDVLLANEIEQSPQGLKQYIQDHSGTTLATKILAVIESMERNEVDVTYDMLKDVVVSCLKKHSIA